MTISLRLNEADSMLFKKYAEMNVIILGYFEPPVRVFGATVPEKGSHEFRCSRATFVPCL